jgi:alpha-beta hydrolase superfamily lysophospholipase
MLYNFLYRRLAVRLELLSQSPVSTPKPIPILFVHGAWHGAWCWENFLPFFASCGYVVYALSLRGHGNSEGAERLRWHSADDYVADVEWAVAQLLAAPVLVGHSMGGYIVQKYLEKHAAPGAVLLASVPVHGMGQLVPRMLARHPLLTLKTHLFLEMRTPFSRPELAREAFFSAGTPDEVVNHCQARLTGESFRLEADALFANLPRPGLVKSPILVLAASGDAIFSVEEEKETARAYGTRAEFFDLAHDMMLEPGWEQVAARIAGWVDER